MSTSANGAPVGTIPTGSHPIRRPRLKRVKSPWNQAPPRLFGDCVKPADRGTLTLTLRRRCGCAGSGEPAIPDCRIRQIEQSIIDRPACRHWVS
jgi:hypothetical protein